MIKITKMNLSQKVKKIFEALNKKDQAGRRRINRHMWRDRESEVGRGESREYVRE